MILELAPGQQLTLEGITYRVEETLTFHDVDFRLDLAKLIGPTPAHERWALAQLNEPYLMLLQRLEHKWLAPPRDSIYHEGEVFHGLYSGSAYSVRRSQGQRSKEGRMEYALFRSDAGHVIFVLMRNEVIEAWSGETLPQGSLPMPERHGAR
jgi:hypothetical protein